MALVAVVAVLAWTLGPGEEPSEQVSSMPGSPTGSDPSETPPGVWRIDPETLTVTGTGAEIAPLGQSDSGDIPHRWPGGLALEGGSVWVTRRDAVMKLDDQAAAVDEAAMAPFKYVAAGDGVVWVISVGQSTSYEWILERVNGATTRSDASIELGATAILEAPGSTTVSGMAYGERTVWVATGNGEIIAVDAASNEVIERTTVFDQIELIVYGDGSLWAVSTFSDTVVIRVDPTSWEVGEPIGLTGAPSGLAYGEGHLWATLCRSGDLAVIDLEDGTVETVPAGETPGDVSVGGGYVWVANGEAGTVTRIDPITRGADTIEVGGNVRAVVADDSGIWVSVVGPGVEVPCG